MWFSKKGPEVDFEWIRVIFSGTAPYGGHRTRLSSMFPKLDESSVLKLNIPFTDARTQGGRPGGRKTR